MFVGLTVVSATHTELAYRISTQLASSPFSKCRLLLVAASVTAEMSAEMEN